MPDFVFGGGDVQGFTNISGDRTPQESNKPKISQEEIDKIILGFAKKELYWSTDDRRRPPEQQIKWKDECRKYLWDTYGIDIQIYT